MESATGSKTRKRFSLRFKLFLVILGVALLCIAASAVISNLLSRRQISQFVREEGLYPPPTVQGSSPGGQQQGTAPRSPGTPPQLQGSAPVPPGYQPQPGDQGYMLGQQRPGEPLPPEPGPKYLNWSVVLAGMLGVVLAMVLSLILARRISRPLSELTSASREITAGNYSERVAAGGGVEVKELGDAFNTLAESLERNEKLRKDMIADIAHELRNPLATLRGQLELVQDGKVPASREAVDSLMEDVELLSRLVDDLRQLTLVEAGQLELDLSAVEVGEPVRSVASRFEHDAAEKEVALVIDLPEFIPMIMADQHRIEQVLGNLVKNALTCTPAGATIRVGATEKPHEVVFTVADTGPGIAPDELPNIFERFYRADRSRTRATGGAGLGLSIARSLVEAHGGRIWAESEVGKGTVISFTVPFKKPD
jgi:signal transduction histidine kinase